MYLQTEMIRAVARTWEPPPSTLELQREEVHVWRGNLSQESHRVAELWPSLCEEEKTRASRFQYPEDADRYILAHGMLRNILLRYRAFVSVPICISLGPKGKPYLPSSSNGPALSFNLSHSPSLFLLAITLDWKLGIDVEPISRPTDWQAIASRYFSAEELQYLFALPAPQREQAFFSLWACKEAYVKAKGEGLSVPLNSFSILQSQDGTLRLVDRKDPGTALNWSFLSLLPDDRHVGALAVEGRASAVSFWEWSNNRTCS